MEHTHCHDKGTTRCTGAHKTAPPTQAEAEPDIPRVRFSSFQAVAVEQSPVPVVMALGRDGRMYIYDWEEETWNQAPDTYVPDIENI